MDLDGAVITADAMHTQTGTAQWIRDQGGHYVLTVKGNQKTLHRTLKAPPCKSIPPISSIERSHGRRVRRTVKAAWAPTWVDFPAAAQADQVRHTRTLKGRKRVEVVYPGALPAHDRRPARDRRNLAISLLTQQHPKQTLPTPCVQERDPGGRRHNEKEERPA